MKYAPIFFLFLFACTEKPPAEQKQWFCKTIADLPTDTVTTGREAYQRAVGYKDKFWPVGYEFRVGFIGGTQTQRDMVKNKAYYWSEAANITFVFPTVGPFDIRVSFDQSDGAWSYVGTDCRSVPASEATMNLGWLDDDVIWHEFGHAIGLLHEHQNPTAPIKWNEAAVIRDLSGSPNYWSEDMIRYNVLNPYPLPNIITTAIDKKSIMMYPIPSAWTLDGFTTPGGLVISDVDKKFIRERYPFAQPPTTGTIQVRKGQIDTLVRRLDSLKIEHENTDKAIRQTLGRN